MELTDNQKAILDDVLIRHNNIVAATIKNPDEVNEDFFVERAFMPSFDLAGVAASISLFNLMKPLSDLVKEANFEDVFLLNTSIETIKDNDPSSLLKLGIFPEDHEEPDPLYVLEYRMEDSKNRKYYTATLKQTVFDEKDDINIANVNMIESDRGDYSIRRFEAPGQFIIPSVITEVVNMLKPVLNNNDTLLSVKKGEMFVKNEECRLLNEDGGVVGPLTTYAVNKVRNEMLDLYAPIITKRSEKVYQELIDNNLIWTKKMIDLSSSGIQFAIPVKNSNIKVIYRENSELLTDYSRHLIVIDEDTENKKELKIYAVDRFNNNMAFTFDNIQRHLFDKNPDIHYDLNNGKIISYSDKSPDMLLTEASFSSYNMQKLEKGLYKDTNRYSGDFEMFFPEDYEEEFSY